MLLQRPQEGETERTGGEGRVGQYLLPQAFRRQTKTGWGGEGGEEMSSKFLVLPLANERIHIYMHI